MQPLVVSAAVFALVFAGALVGMLIRTTLPPHHVSTDSKDVVRLGMGVIATLAALVLGLVTASTNTSYGTRSSEVIQVTANIVLLDRILAHFGPETGDARDLLRHSMASFVSRVWLTTRADAATSSPIYTTSEGEEFYDAIEKLSVQNDAQRSLKGRAIDLAIELGQTRLLLMAQAGSSIPMPFLWMLAIWFTLIFASFGIFAPPPNSTCIGAMAVCAYRSLRQYF